MDINKLTLGEAKQKLQEYKELAQALNQPVESNDDSHWCIGKNYFIRTVTHHYTGRLVKVTEKELVVEDAAWIADDGKFSDALRDENFSEVEPYPDGLLILGRGAILDAFVIKKLQRKVK